MIGSFQELIQVYHVHDISEIICADLRDHYSANASDYCPDTLFENDLCLYNFDEELRHILRKYIEIVEVYYRTVISHEFAMAKCLDEPHDQHYDEQSYYNKAGFNDIKKHFEQEKNYYKDSLIMKHHNKNFY